MSVTKDIACDQCKVSLWIGQSSIGGDSFYSGEPDTMEKLRQFLFEHEGHPLRFLPREMFSDWDYKELDK